jgi:hypothetical protein
MFNYFGQSQNIMMDDNHTWMDDIEIGTNVFITNAQQDCFPTTITN